MKTICLKVTAKDINLRDVQEALKSYFPFMDTTVEIASNDADLKGALEYLVHCAIQIQEGRRSDEAFGNLSIATDKACDILAENQSTLSTYIELKEALTEIVSGIDQGGSGGKVFARDACIQRAREVLSRLAK